MYQLETIVYDNLAGTDLTDLSGIYAPNPYRAVFEFSSESYWHFNKFAYDVIIPEHIFNDNTGIGFEGWNTWHPVFVPTHPHVTSGPFIFTEYDNREDTYELTRNSNYYYLDPDTPPIGNTQNPRPVVHSSSDVSYIVGTTGNEILWEVSDDNPLSYRITNNSVPCYNGPWDGSDIVYNIDGLEIGVYEFTLDLFDESGNVAHNTVHVYVVTDLNITTNTDSLLSTFILVGLASGTSIIMIIVVVKLYHSKKVVEEAPILENE
jgi:ABC-type transport system substrate-binding protein